ncbi:MAG: zf-HC2 domain-containing protein [Verrucomicrobia bacterium]|nr:zf-HC2 domain-containing protein [Verrucomicrobiota bacterium]MCG2681804.1 zf-HC2 domain-containing protein [Kiritimatiellia bacterium]MBU4247285.1 zf-HC2 domain-containing protein [Verrucomicrobiota bacterium]MBU4289901.1 zf-HC2 domain-containing protein [Verrucomicrobiota bacterium]MBU4427955.1 zf-HC2 domain-containing protein [Verrucomicrobiota bacterium]
MNCNQYQEWVSAEIDGRLDQRQAQLLREHLAACPACRQVKADLERTIALIRTLPNIEPPPDLLDSIHQRLAVEPETRRVWRILTMPLTRVALAVALLMIIVIYGYRPMTSVTRDVQSVKTDGQIIGGGKSPESAQTKHANLVPTPNAGESSGAEPAKRAPASSMLEAHPLALKAEPAHRLQDLDAVPALENNLEMVAAAKMIETKRTEKRVRTDDLAIADQDKQKGAKAVSFHSIRKMSSHAGGKIIEEKHGAPADIAQEAVLMKDKAGNQLAVAFAVPTLPGEPPPAASQYPIEKKPQLPQTARAGVVDHKAGASTPDREPSVKLLVVTSDPAAVMRLLEPYRQEQIRDRATKERSDAADKPGVVWGQEKNVEQAPKHRSRSQPQGQAVDALTTIWVSAREYSELLKKIRVLGKITDDNQPAAQTQSDMFDPHSGASQSTELISVQVRIQPR